MSVKEKSRSRIPLLGDSNNALVLLISINILVFILLNFLKIVYFLSYENNIAAETFFQKQILDWFVLPAQTEHLLNKPWVIFTYMFSHYSVWGLISTCLWIWGFGYILQDLTGNKKIEMGQRARRSYEKNFAITSSARKFYDAISKNYVRETGLKSTLQL